ncbi:apolipoprotein N-acyltransferase [Sedimentitalea todarodis]|uniref:Apolipoprotein N-acyltransferase n=1 Tax=Sedimentitalea todarodis TaxID=1631240 RepID=A0ABU3VD17_9RHOB|nr:apolipoprotein N-acyltransferase [Sedimentitalea todarodis]MDU9004072.1 apolipoprotein N-acyltransferase [Sedimentitalea todarodis]
MISPPGGLLLRMGVAAGFGALAALGLAPYGLWPVTLIAFALVPWLLQGTDSPRRAAWIGWALATGYFALALNWIVEPFLVDIARHGWMAPFALVLLSGGLALFWAAAFWLAIRFSKTQGMRIGLLIATLSLAEFARAYVLTGFPWAGLAQIWVGTDVVLWLAWIGPQGLGALTLIASLLPGHALVSKARLGARLLCGLPVLTLLLAGVELARALPETHPSPGTVRIIQPNAPQHQKWDPEMMPVFFQRQIDFTAAQPQPDLIVWPETAVPVLLDYAGPALARMSEAAAGVPMAVGIQRSEGARHYNSLIYLDGVGDIAAVYDKHHLVPFGEYFPGGDFASALGLRGFAAREGDGYSAGPGPVLLDFGPLGQALPLICYEAVFPQDVSGTASRGAFLLQITNDAWFGQYAGPYQHLAQAQMRAVEQGLPMVRAANTGVSAMIDPWGRITDSLPLGEAGYVDATLPAPLPGTHYSRSGDWPVLCLLLVGLIPLLRRGREIKGA